MVMFVTMPVVVGLVLVVRFMFSIRSSQCGYGAQHPEKSDEEFEHADIEI